MHPSGSINENEENLREISNRFINAFEYAAIGMALVSLEGRWIQVNNSVCVMLGYTEDELLKMTFQEITHPDDLETDLNNMKQMIESEIETYQMEKRYIHKTGKILWGRLSVSLMRDSDKKPLYFISQIENITDRIKAQQELMENQQRLKLATSSAQIGVWDLDVNLNVLTWDDQMFTLYGKNREDFDGTVSEWVNSIHPKDKSQAFEAYQAALNGEKDFDEEFRIICPNNEIKHIHSTAILLRDSKGNPTRMIGVNRDITKQKNYLNQLKEMNENLRTARKEAEKSAQIKSQFLDIAAHELRTPVTAFSLLLQNTQKKLSKGECVDESILKRLQIQVDRISRLVVDLLDVSRLERGVLNLKIESTNICMLIDQCLEDYKLREPSREIQFHRPKESLFIEIDPIRIYQVISNIIDNAIKYTPEETPIDLRIEIIPNYLRILIIDSGPGISEENQAGIFSVFARGKGLETEKSGGLGLGLYVSKTIVELHHGKIGVKSQMNKGSTFYFDLPYKE